MLEVISSMTDWIDDELATVDLGDRRRRRRLKRMVARLVQRPGSSIPKAFATHAEATAAYRFLHSPAVAASAIMAGIHRAVGQRAAAHELVLAIQDATTFSYQQHPATRGLGPLRSCAATHGYVQGFLMHSVLVASPAGVPIVPCLSQ
jgi:hypothetical protein